MNTLIFSLGFLSGFSTLTVIIIAWTFGIKRDATKEAKEANAETIRLMTERNATDREIAQSLHAISKRHGDW